MYKKVCFEHVEHLTQNMPVLFYENLTRKITVIHKAYIETFKTGLFLKGFDAKRVVFNFSPLRSKDIF